MSEHNSSLILEESLEALSQTQGDIASFSKIYDQIDELQQMLSSLEVTTTEQEQAVQSNLKPLEVFLGTLKDNSGTLQDQASGLFDQAKSQNSDFYETVNQSLDSLRQKLDECSTQASSLSEQGQSLNGECESQLQEIQANTTQLQSLLEEVKSDFETRKSSLLEGFESIEQEAQVRLQTLTENYSTLLDEGNNHLHELESLLDNTSGEAILALSRKFEEEVLTQLTQSAGELSQLIEGVGSAGEASQDLLQEEVGSVLDKLGEVTQLIEQIKPILDLVKEML
jgi:ABC-type transporter Mla subunit MlaD